MSSHYHMPEQRQVSVDGFRPLVVGLGGSTRRASRALEALGVSLRGAVDSGAETLLLSVRDLSLPILNAEQPEWEQEPVQTLLAGIRRAHGVILASPVYQESISGALKNALDYLVVLENEGAPGLSGKAVGLISVSGSLPSMGASLGMRAACKGLGGWVLPEHVDLGSTSYNSDGRLCDLLARDRLLELGRRLVLGIVARQAQDEVGGIGATSMANRT
jgi:FMN reductase